VTLDNAIKLVFALPEKMVRQIRDAFIEVLKRYLAGDQSLIGEINTNAKSTSPIHKMARDALGRDGEEHDAGREIKDEESFQKKQRLIDTAREHHVSFQLKNVESFTSLLNSIDPKWTEDSSLRDHAKGWLKKIAIEQSSSNPEDVPQISKKSRVEIVEEPMEASPVPEKEASPIPGDLPAAEEREEVVVDAMRKFFAKEFEECGQESLLYSDIFDAFSESFCIASGRDEEIFSQQCQPLLTSQFPFVWQCISDNQRAFINVRRKHP